MMRNGWQSSYCWKEVRAGKAAKLTRKTCWLLFWFRAACIICPGLKASELVELGLRPWRWEALDGGPWRARGHWGPESAAFSVSQFFLPLQFGFDVGENPFCSLSIGQTSSCMVIPDGTGGEEERNTDSITRTTEFLLQNIGKAFSSLAARQ